MAPLLNDDERNHAVDQLEGWTVSEDGRSIKKKFSFFSFSEAFAWMTRVALYAEKKNHHPSWKNFYNIVEVTLTTEDVQGLTYYDLGLAKAMDKLYHH